MEFFFLAAYATLAASSIIFQQLLACLNFSLDLHFPLLVQSKRVVSMGYNSSTSCWKPYKWVKFDWILTMSNICVNSNLSPLTKFTSSSSRSSEFKDILPWKSLKWSWGSSNQHEKSHNLLDETEHPVLS